MVDKFLGVYAYPKAKPLTFAQLRVIKQMKGESGVHYDVRLKDLIRQLEYDIK